jgi:hypothetical protein
MGVENGVKNENACILYGIYKGPVVDSFFKYE